MSEPAPRPSFTAFLGFKRLATGPLSEVALAAKRAIDRGSRHAVSIFNDHSGLAIDVNSGESDSEILARLARPTPASAPRGRGRPKLGVVAREVTLLPKHWQWLASQPGGASVSIRKLVEAAGCTHQEVNDRRSRQRVANHFMRSLAGNLANFDEATLALFANQRARFEALIASWPTDVREHAVKLAFGLVGN